MYENFENWLDEALCAQIPREAIALNFNIYEDGDNLWSVELVAADRFDPADADWACDEVFAERETPYEWEEEAHWQDILEEVVGLLRKYMENGAHREKMLSYDGIGTGFVDGDIVILHIKN